jgi:hypothetical protein
MKTLLGSLLFALLCVIIVALATDDAHAGIAFLTGQEVSGLNKICYYTGPEGDFAITIRSTSMCPLSIDT